MQPVKEKKSTFSFFKSKKPVSDSSKLSSTNSIGRTAIHVDSKIDVKSQNVTYTASTSFPPQSNASRKLPTPPPRKTQVNDQPLTKTIQGQTFNIIFAPKEEIDAFEESVMTYVNMKADIERKNDEFDRKKDELERREAELIASSQKSKERIAEILEKDEFHLQSNLNKYNQALQNLPVNWEKTGETDLNYYVMQRAINDAITLIKEYRVEFKGITWNDEKENKRGLLGDAMDIADKIIEYVNYLKNR